LSSTLRQELLVEADAGTPIPAAFADGRPVAFCYPGSVTERWWDISIDTIDAYRRRGYAARCVSFCIEEMARAGKQPVWGALESNPPSLRLAAKVGFEPVDRIFVFSSETEKLA
jgi:RimJ/RimL family protein N-acetyltransferase